MAQKRHFLFLTIIVSCLTNTAAQPSANAFLSKNRVETGDTFNLRILVSGSPAVPESVDFSMWKAFLPAENILNQSNWARSGNNWAKDFTLISFDSADLKLPPLTVRLRLKDSIKTNPLELRVSPTPASGGLAEMADIRDLHRAPASWLDHWKWILAGLVLLVLTLFFLRKKPKPQPAAPLPVFEKLVSLLDLTMQKLDDLERRTSTGSTSNGSTSTRFKTSSTFDATGFCTELSFIVREFLEKKYAIKALESTTKEILGFLKNTDFPENQAAALRELLQQTDFSKFSEMAPPPDFAEKALFKTRTIVQKATDKIG